MLFKSPAHRTALQRHHARQGNGCPSDAVDAIAVERARELRDRSRIEVLRDRNPIEFMKRRADRLAQRSADLKRLAEAREPLYQTLTPQQKRRMAFLAIIAVREMRDAVEDRRVRSEDDNDDE